jgi:hypothetical protein
MDDSSAHQGREEDALRTNESCVAGCCPNPITAALRSAVEGTPELTSEKIKESAQSVAPITTWYGSRARM